MSNVEKILFVPDLHCPYHDERGWKLMMKMAKDFKPNTIVVLGDFIDCFAISTYSKDPTRALGLEKEVALTLKKRQELDDLGAKRKIFIEGNHEDRLKRYLQDKAPELFTFVDIPKLLHLEENGWEHVPYKKAIKLGKLWITHDTGHTGRYTTFKALDTFQHPVVIAHSHRIAYAVEGNATGEAIVGAQFGWLGDVEKVDYMHKIRALREWALGFGYGYLQKNTGYVSLIPVAIINYTAVVEGKLYKA